MLLRLKTRIHPLKTSTLSPSGVLTYRGGSLPKSLSKSNIISVTVEEGVTNIPGSTLQSRGAFYECENLVSVACSKSCMSISKSAFHNCPLLTKITFHDLCKVHPKATRNCLILTMLSVRLGFSSVNEHLMNKHNMDKRGVFIAHVMLAFNRCDQLRITNNNNDGICDVEKDDILVMVYRRITSVDLWRRILAFTSIESLGYAV